MFGDERDRFEGSNFMRHVAFAALALAAALAGCAANPYTYDTSRSFAAPAPAASCPTVVTSTGYMIYRC
jgi:hypothetical protein